MEIYRFATSYNASELIRCAVILALGRAQKRESARTSVQFFATEQYGARDNILPPASHCKPEELVFQKVHRTLGTADDDRDSHTR